MSFPRGEWQTTSDLYDISGPLITVLLKRKFDIQIDEYDKFSLNNESVYTNGSCMRPSVPFALDNPQTSLSTPH